MLRFAVCVALVGALSGRVARQPKQLYVKGLQRGTTLSDVRLAFEAVCEVTAVSMPRDKETGLNKGFAFVELAEESDSTYVCGCMDGASVGGKPIICRIQDEARLNAKPESAVLLNKRLIAAATAADILTLCDATTLASGTFTVVNLATALHRLARCGRSFERSRGDPRLGALVDAATASLSENPEAWEPRHVANVLTALQKLKVEAPLLLRAAEAATRPGDCEPQALSAISLALADALTSGTLRLRPETCKLFDDVATVSMAKLTRFNALELSGLADAFAKRRRHARRADPTPDANADHGDALLYDAISNAAAKCVDAPKVLLKLLDTLSSLGTARFSLAQNHALRAAAERLARDPKISNSDAVKIEAALARLRPRE